MFKFSKRSLRKLDKVWPPLAALAHRVLDKSEIDIGITDGLRTSKEQNKLYQIGRTTSGNIVTHKDGYKNKSYHQSGYAIDFAIYKGSKIDWNDYDSYLYIGKLFKEEFLKMQSEGIMPNDKKLIHGGTDWGWDFPHIQIS